VVLPGKTAVDQSGAYPGGQQQLRWIHRNCDGVRKNNGVDGRARGG